MKIDVKRLPSEIKLMLREESLRRGFFLRYLVRDGVVVEAKKKDGGAAFFVLPRFKGLLAIIRLLWGGFRPSLAWRARGSGYVEATLGEAKKYIETYY